MKKIILFVFLALIFNACKKDYPLDIPHWLQEMILKAKRTHGCFLYGKTLWIDEYKKGDSTFYMMHWYEERGYAIFDANGNTICTENNMGGDCEPHILPYLIHSRHIWNDDPNKCQDGFY
ncbi:MAG: hypothetical protein WCH34_08700 [Bacteroidota bacterium]